MRRRGADQAVGFAEALGVILSTPVDAQGRPIHPPWMGPAERAEFSLRWRAGGRRLLEVDPELYAPLVELFGEPA